MDSSYGSTQTPSPCGGEIDGCRTFFCKKIRVSNGTY
nr:MAG TPA: hypothetical protein [Herelleviridae sp.]